MPKQPTCRIVAVRPSGERVEVSKSVPRELAERIMAVIEMDLSVWDFKDPRIEEDGESNGHCD